jgi:hypothetical protein
MESEVCSHKYLEELEIGLCCLSCGALRNFVSKASDTTSTSNTESDEEYQYMPLRPDEIRLVVLLPDSEDHLISCRILTVQLQAAAAYEYEAVSYTWATEDGDASKTKSINICIEESQETKSMRVTTNCEIALQQLRRHYSEIRQRHVVELQKPEGHGSERPMLGDYVLWIDSICINQECISERNQQVRIMDEIYKNAVQVDVCISIRGQDYRGAMELLDYNRMIESQDLPSRESNLLDYTKAIEKYFPSKNQPRHELRPRYVQLASLFGLRYFSRVWVVQEILLSQDAFLYVNNEVVPLKEQILRSICDICISRYVSIPWLSRWVSVWNKAPGIILCLNMSLNCSASDARDKVFAITGLLHPCTRTMIPIDYISSVDEVMATAVTACIAECGDLDILSYAVLPKGADPHTAPSLSRAQFREYLVHQGSRGASDPSQTWTRYDHARFLSPSFPSVAMKGGCKRCGPPIQNSTAWDSTCAFQCTKSSPGSTFERLNLPIPANQVLPRLSVRAYPLDNCTESTDQSLPDFLDELHKGVHAHNLPWILGLVQEPYAKGIQELVTDLLFVRGQMRTSVDYTVFRTRHSVGFTSGYCLPGDIVATIEGATHAFILRGVGYRKFRIVGECHLWDQYKVASKNNGSLGRVSGGDCFRGMGQYIEIY